MIAAAVDKQAIHESFRSWQTNEESLDAQLNESLAALEAYQSHLDDWQQQLVREREEIRLAKEELAQAPAMSTDCDQATAAGLEAAHQQISKLKEELYQLEQSRAELATELESARKDPRPTPKQSPDRTPPTGGAPPQAGGKGHSRSASPVLGSIVEQFGKLRLQRALDRQSGKPPARTKD